MTVAWFARPGHLPGGDLQSGEQGGGAVPHIVVGAFLTRVRLHRQHRRGPVEGLDLALLIHAQHDRVTRWGQVQPDHIAHLRDQFGIGGELERLRPPRRHPVLPPRRGHRLVPDPQVRPEQPARPVRHPVLLRRRYAGRGLAGLADEPRSGRPRTIDHRGIVSTTLRPPPKKYGVTHWSSRLLGTHLGIGNKTVATAWREY